METGMGFLVGSLLCGGLTCIGLAFVILAAVMLFWNQSQGASTLPAEPVSRPVPRASEQATVLTSFAEPEPEPEPDPDLFDEDAMSTVVSPPSGPLPSAPPPPPSAPPPPTPSVAPEDAPPPPPRRPRSAGPTIITFEDDD